MTLQQAIETIRIALGDRDDRHPNCNFLKPRSSRKQTNIDTCDCYCQRIQIPHQAMDQIEAFIKKMVASTKKTG